MEQQDLHLQRLGLGSLASNQVGSWGASLLSGLQDRPLDSQDLSGHSQLVGSSLARGLAKKATLQNSLAYVSPNLASASNPDETTL